MIPNQFIETWNTEAKWQTLAMVEQDMVISRALICLYNDEDLKNSLVFRGGTALNKLFLKPAARYSEDIDFVQKHPEPIGKTMDGIRNALKLWLGEPKRKVTERSAKLIYRYLAIDGLPAKLKIEINTTEHFQVLPLKFEPFLMKSDWFSGKCQITTYQIEELMATKLRALFQRRKGRDLFDLWLVLKHELIDTDTMIDIFKKYCAHDNLKISKDVFQKNMRTKRVNKDFQTDMNILLSNHIDWNFDEAYDLVGNLIINQLQ